MTGMLPDSGVPPAEARNTLPDPSTVNCQELWYSTSRCQPRFDPAAANAMLSELINLVNKGEVVYDCNKLDQVQFAVRYLIQRGLCCGTWLGGGPFDYYAGLDPPATRYNDLMTLIVVPVVDNQAAVRINTDNLGMISLLRNDGQPLQAKDLRGGVPALISFRGGYWWHVGLCPSQVPIIVTGAVDIWVRTDGNDITGDGSANTPDKAFRTLQGAWNKVGSRFAATPLFTMNINLGLPGTYAGAIFASFGGNVWITGAGGGPRSGYRLSSVDLSNNIWGNLFFVAMGSVALNNLTLVRDVPPPINGCILRIANSNVVVYNCDWESTVGNVNSQFIYIYNGGKFGAGPGTLSFNGRNLPVGQLVQVDSGSVFSGGYDIRGTNYYFYDCPTNYSLVASGVSMMTWGNSNIGFSNCTGPRYAVVENSIMRMAGEQAPGSLPGLVGSGGQYIP